MTFRIRILGSEPAWPSASRACSGFLVQTGRSMVLVDCGTGVFERLRAVLPPEELTGVVISHLHFDHWTDLIPFRYYLSFDARPHVRPDLHLPPGAIEKLQKVTESIDPEPRFFTDVFETSEYDPRGELRVGDLRITFRQTLHPIETYALKLISGDRTVVYSADTGWTESMGDFAREADLFICEATWGAEEGGHPPLRGRGGPAGRAGRSEEVSADPPGRAGGGGRRAGRPRGVRRPGAVRRGRPESAAVEIRRILGSLGRRYQVERNRGVNEPPLRIYLEDDTQTLREAINYGRWAKKGGSMPRAVEVPEYEVAEEVRVDPSGAALVVVDMQNDFVKEGGSLVVPDAEGTIPAIRSLLELARGSGMKVVYSQDTHTEGDPEWEIWPEHAREGSWGWQIVDEISPLEDELVIRKVRYDAFYGTHLDHFLRTWGVDTLVICGTVANICVHYTAASGALRWYDVIIPRDATSALDPFDLESSLRQTAFLFAGKITQSAAIRARDSSVYRSKIEEAAVTSEDG